MTSTCLRLVDALRRAQDPMSCLRTRYWDLAALRVYKEELEQAKFPFSSSINQPTHQPTPYKVVYYFL